ncbi:MAG: DUF58 domain-containing protein [Planctomycetes bacterium]|nr:DUF58 domain-containing protein [Planctomycetota bacterium]
MAGFRYLPPHLADRLAGLSVSARRAMGGSRQGAHRSTRHGASVEFAEYRDYVPGDSPSLIDWSVYARTDRHLVKRFEEETDLAAYVLLDRTGSMDWRGSGPMRKWDYACHLAAALLYILVRQGDRAGLVVCGGAEPEHHVPAASVGGLKPMLDALEAAAPAGRGDVAAAVEQAAERLPRRCLVVLVGDLLQPPEALARAVRRLHHEGRDVRVIQVADPAELVLPEHGLAELVDAETGEKVEADLDEVRDGWRAAAEEHIAAMRRACHACPAEHRLVTTDQPFVSALRGM